LALPFFVKAATAVLREFPRLNAEVQGDEMVLKHYYDIGVLPVLLKASSFPCFGMPTACRSPRSRPAFASL
jgi:hypothetical protein